MGIQPPFLYDPVKQDNIWDFDPKAVTRASLTPKATRPKLQAPLISFNQHPDSHLISPHRKMPAKPMNPSIKKWIKWMRIIQLVLRCLELISSVGVLVLMVLIKGVDLAIGWIIRIAPGIAILHTAYGIFHLARKPSGRSPASSASYMIFASFLDVSIVPFYAFTALVTMKENGWSTLLPNQALTQIFSEAVFHLVIVGGGLHLVSLSISLYLAITFRKINKLPPDMNPLEDNLTSRHKRNKSSVSATMTMPEKHPSGPLENKRSSGAAYQDLTRTPTIPFLSTRILSTNSRSTYKSTPPPSPDSNLNIHSREYQLRTVPSSLVDLTHNSSYGSSPPSPKRASYTEVPLSDTSSLRSARQVDNMPELWYTADSSLPNKHNRTSSPKKAAYRPLHQRRDSSEDIWPDLPNPLEANPPTPRHACFPGRDFPLSDISNNRVSTDIADTAFALRAASPQEENFKTKYYGDLQFGKPPAMIGNSRQLSSGNDLGVKVLGRRGVSGKIAEEGRGGPGNWWGTRFRKISGLGVDE